MILSGRNFPTRSHISKEKFFLSFGNGWICDTNNVEDKDTYFSLYNSAGTQRSFDVSDFFPMNNIDLEKFDFSVEYIELTDKFIITFFERVSNDIVNQGVYEYEGILNVINALYDWRGGV